MHFSRPSGHRLSWCRPWNRGAVGTFSNGYCSVTTFRNMVRKVTPNPATGSQNCSLSVGIGSGPILCLGVRTCGHGGAGLEGQRLGGTAYGAAGGHRRGREPSRPRSGLLPRRALLVRPLLFVAEEEEDDHA